MTEDPGASDRFWIAENGATYGPADLATIQRWANEGRITARSMAMREGGTNWLPVASWLDIVFPARQAPSSTTGGLGQPFVEERSSAAFWVFAVLLGLAVGGPIVGGMLRLGAAGIGPPMESSCDPGTPSLPLFGKRSVRTPETQRAEHEAAIERACAAYKADVGRYPDTVDELMRFSGPDGYAGPYLSYPKVPVDPFSGQPYEIENGRIVSPPAMRDPLVAVGGT